MGGCGCTELQNTNCYCSCENLTVPQGPQGGAGATGADGGIGATGNDGADGADAFNAQLSSDAVAINLADTVNAFAGLPPVAYKYYNDTITTVFSLTEGGVPVAIDIANMTLSYGGEMRLATITNVAGGIQLELVRGLAVPVSNYGYVDMTYTHGALIFIKRFNVVYVSDGSTFLVGETDPTAVADPQEGQELLTLAGKVMRYQGGAWIQKLDVNQTAVKSVTLTGAAYTLSLISTDERVISLIGSGTVNNDISINLPVAGVAAGTEFKVLYNATMTAGTGDITIFGIVLSTDLYNEQLGIDAIFDGTAWIVSTVFSTAMLKAFGNITFYITPTVGTTTVTYNVPDSKTTNVLYIVAPPAATDNAINFYLGNLVTDLASVTTRRIEFVIKNIPEVAAFTDPAIGIWYTYRINGGAIVTGPPSIMYGITLPFDNSNVRYYMDKSTGTVIPTTAVFQTVEFFRHHLIVIDYTKLSEPSYKEYLLRLPDAPVLWSYDGAAVSEITGLYV